jgi:hypothetical protein
MSVLQTVYEEISDATCGNAIRTTNKLCICRSHLWRSKHEVGLVPSGVTVGDNIKMLFKSMRSEGVWTVFFCLTTGTGFVSEILLMVSIYSRCL